MKTDDHQQLEKLKSKEDTSRSYLLDGPTGQVRQNRQHITVVYRLPLPIVELRLQALQDITVYIRLIFQQGQRPELLHVLLIISASKEGNRLIIVNIFM